MIKKLENKMPAFEEFKANFDTKLYFSSKETKQKKLVQYVLKKIELKEQNYNVDMMNISLEHIYPEKPNSDWENLEEPELFKTIGNLVILDSSINSKVGNKSFDAKKAAVLKDSTLLSTKNIFANNSSWTATDILARRDKLMDLMYKNIWND